MPFQTEYGMSDDERAANAECRRNHGWRVWVVTVFKGNFSAFNGYHFTPSDYSEIRCTTCGRRWRTRAAYADRLPGATEEDWAKINKAIGVTT